MPFLYLLRSELEVVAALLVCSLYYRGSVDEDHHIPSHAFSRAPSLGNEEVAPYYADTVVASNEAGKRLTDFLLHYLRPGGPSS